MMQDRPIVKCFDSEIYSASLHHCMVSVSIRAVLETLSPVQSSRAFIQPLVSGGVWHCRGRGASSGRRPRVDARSAERERGLETGCPLPRDGGPDYHSRGKFWNLRRTLVQSDAVCEIGKYFWEGHCSHARQRPCRRVQEFGFWIHSWPP